MSRFSSKQIVAMVCAVSGAVVLAPVGVMAATGQIVNVVDPSNAGRAARVAPVGALQVETRPGIVTNAANVVATDINTLAPRRLMEVTSPSRIALSELTVAVRKNGTPAAADTVVELHSYVRDSGTAACGGSGWSDTLLRRVTLQTSQTLQLDFDGPPLVIPAAPVGKRQCLAAKLYQWVDATKVEIGATVYSYTN